MDKNIRSQAYQLKRQSATPTPPSNAATPSSPTKPKIFNIPLIAKRLNKVEKYVRSFHNSTVSVNASHNPQSQIVSGLNSRFSELQQYSDTLNPGTPKNHHNSLFLSEVDHKKSEKDVLSGLIYTTLNSKDTVSKVTSLNRLQESYAEMKSRIKVHHRLPRISNLKLKDPQNARDNSWEEVSQEQIERHIKSSMVEQQGKKYYGDLYLLKRGRDKIMQSLETIGRQDGDAVRPFEKIVHDVENYNSDKSASEQHTKQMILQERQLKKNKMITNKHMHWNVYYDILALSRHEKGKLQKGCRFGSRYGID